MGIRFKAMVRRGATSAKYASYVVTIPKDYVDNGLIKAGVETEFEIVPSHGWNGLLTRDVPSFAKFSVLGWFHEKTMAEYGCLAESA